MSVSRIATRTVVTAAPGEHIVDVARRMDEHGVGTAVVVDASSHPVGIVTDRDIAMRCVAREHDPHDTIAVIMTREVRTVDEGTPIEQALQSMASHGKRRLVVTGEGGRTVGLLSVDDVMRLLVEEAASIGELLDKEAPHILSH